MNDTIRGGATGSSPGFEPGDSGSSPDRGAIASNPRVVELRRLVAIADKQAQPHGCWCASCSGDGTWMSAPCKDCKGVGCMGGDQCVRCELVRLIQVELGRSADLAAKAEAAKAWRPSSDEDYGNDGESRAVAEIGRCVVAVQLGEACAAGRMPLTMRARIWHDANDAATIASYFGDEPNPVSVWRDAVVEWLQ